MFGFSIKSMLPSERYSRIDPHSSLSILYIVRIGKRKKNLLDVLKVMMVDGRMVKICARTHEQRMR